MRGVLVPLISDWLRICRYGSLGAHLQDPAARPTFEELSCLEMDDISAEQEDLAESSGNWEHWLSNTGVQGSRGRAEQGSKFGSDPNSWGYVEVLQFLRINSLEVFENVMYRNGTHNGCPQFWRARLRLRLRLNLPPLR